MTAQFLFSFDCESKWGIADRGNDKLNLINSRDLIKVYSKILSLLDKYELKMSFGFVAALCLDEEQLYYRIKLDKDAIVYNDNLWLTKVWDDYNRNKIDGWSMPSLIDLVRNSGHHICSHGGYHVPYCEKNTPISTVERDIELIKHVSNMKKYDSSIMIMPRNILGFEKVLIENNILFYRAMDKQEKINSRNGKIVRLINEFHSGDKGDLLQNYARTNNNGMTALTSAKFFNARIGVRKIVPNSISIYRINQLLSHIIKNSGTLHFYSHPHNFLVDKTLFDRFEKLLKILKYHEQRDEIIIKTMKDECVL